MLHEKELLTFAVLQWVVVALAYYLWVQIVGWIPMSVWESSRNGGGIFLDLAVTAWSFACVALAAYPIGLFTGCTGAAHLLHRQGVPCSIAACLAMVLPRAGSLRAFHVTDGWITVEQILKRCRRRAGA